MKKGLRLLAVAGLMVFSLSSFMPAKNVFTAAEQQQVSCRIHLMLKSRICCESHLTLKNRTSYVAHLMLKSKTSGGIHLMIKNMICCHIFLTPEHTEIWKIVWPTRWGYTKGEKKKASDKAKYIFRRLFPSMDTIEEFFPFFYKHKWAIPFLYIYRIGKMPFTRRKKVAGELREVFKK